MNLQNIPSHNKEIRKMFSASEGCVFVGGDYSQQEPRSLAHMSQDKNLIHAYQVGKDVYAWIASLVYNMPYEECKEFRPDGTVNPEGKERRSFCKSIVLGLMYGRGDKSVAEQIGVSVQEARKLIKNFFDSFPEVETFIQETQKQAHKNGYVTTAWGRVRHLPDMMLDDYEFSYAEGVAEDFDPLDFEHDTVISEVPKKIKDKYTKKLEKTYSFTERNHIQDELRQQGIILKNNSGKVAEASRQCVNSVIQGM